MNPRVFVLALSTFSFGSSAFIFAGLLESMAVDLGVSTGAVGQLQTAYVLTSALAGPPLAMLLGRRERKGVLLTALGAAIVFSLLCMFAANFSQLLVLRAILGGIAALAGPAASTMAASLVAPERRGSAMATVMGGMTIAFLLGIPLGSVVGAAFGWRSTFALSALLSVIAFAAVAVFIPRVQAPAPIKGGKLAIGVAAPLWAATFLRRRGVAAAAILLNPERTHAQALSAFRSAGGRLVSNVSATTDLVIDGVVGISGTGPLRPAAAAVFAAAGRAPQIEYSAMPPAIREKYQYFTQAEMAGLREAGYDRDFTGLEDGIADYVGRYLSQPDPYR